MPDILRRVDLKRMGQREHLQGQRGDCGKDCKRRLQALKSYNLDIKKQEQDSPLYPQKAFGGRAAGDNKA